MDSDVRTLERRLVADADDVAARRELVSTHTRAGRPLTAFAVLHRARFDAPTLERLGDDDVPVVLIDERGTKGETFARRIHEASPRREGRFLVENAEALSPTLLESELFGYLKGTTFGGPVRRRGLFEAAAGGTFFLSGLVKPEAILQQKLSRLFETKTIVPLGMRDSITVDLRLILGTRRAARRRFRAFFDHVEGVEVRFPPLNERRADIPLLLEHRRCPVFAPEALDALLNHRWPLNDRELDAEIDRLLELKIERVEKQDLADDIRRARRSRRRGPPSRRP